ncbi:efflux RND transporter periplasmic adaptor subunit [Lichenifustis flavocetrariae]|uniref:Efflux RND transporter periplasmic adaptor subunit n=1 Tax=Lichenifustis flavocetrariae TaxID=2949735 RepID=A0AA41Z207_9HYPH|nr:efflux RND transporter periplasmic adaptor subunit [Lichenifustis flavocetrariae]MCW6511398.1 efflux RND transporter periplasmic adaptor subunit [Lichenifustis flavocetrariae]
MSRAFVCVAIGFTMISAALAQAPGNAPPAVGVEKVGLKPIIETERFIGRIQAVEQVDLVARVTAFLEKIVFTEGQEVEKGATLYQLEQPPFQADVQAKQATIEQIQAQLANANVTLERAQTLLNTPAGQQSTVDSAKANQGNLQGQLLAAEANLRTSQIELGYTTITAPIDGKIGRTSITVGNVVTPSSGTLATIVRQDPMYVVFPISVRSALELRSRYAGKGGFAAVQIKIVLPDGRTYGQVGKLNFVNNTIASSTDTIILRGTIPNPVLPQQQGKDGAVRELVDGEFVQVLLEGVQPVQVLSIPRAAVSTDQQGDFVYVLSDDNKAMRQNVTLGQSTPTEASIVSGLKEGQTIIVDGIQRVRAGQPVSPGPAIVTPAEQAQKPAP